MLKRPTDYETAQAATSGSTPTLPAGGHGCYIKKAEVVTMDYDGKRSTQLHVYFDIRENGPYDDYYLKKYNAGQRWGTPKWQGVFKQRVYGETNGTEDESVTNPYFKGLVTAIEESNPGFKWDWNEQSLRGKKIGFIFREEEFLTQEKEVKTTVRAAWCCGYDGAGEIEAPAIKKLDPSKLPANVAHPELTPAPEEKLPWEE